MMNYSSKLMSLKSEALLEPTSSFPIGELLQLTPLASTKAFETEIRRLAKHLPFKTAQWPSFGSYTEDWYMVEVDQFNRKIYYCERGTSNLRKSCPNIIDLAYEIFRIVSPSLTKSAKAIADSLDQIEDQRLLIWLRMSSEIFHMSQINQYFGLRTAVSNVAWMSEELVRMGIFENPLLAFNEQNYILHGLTLSGLPGKEAAVMFDQLKYK